MAVRKVKENIYSVGAIDWDRRLFDELLPLPEGTSYNSYLIKGSEKTALIDTVDPIMTEILLDNIERTGTQKIDYVIVQHAEQDHSGSTPEVLVTYPEAKVVTNQKCKDMLKDLLLIPDDRFIVVGDKETVSLGDKTLEFTLTPWVHWPETMVTYLKEDKILFTCDFLGSHYATSDLYADDESKVYYAAKRYFAEIMMPFRGVVKTNLEKIKGLDIDIVAPGHGPAYNNTKFILDAYNDWVMDEVQNHVIIPYISMHGSTHRMVEHLTDALIERGIKVTPFEMNQTDIGELAIALVDAATIVIGSPVVLGGAHPNIVYAAYLANALRPKAKFASIVGSYGWGCKLVESLSAMIPNLKVEIIEPVLAKGFPKDEDFVALDNLANKILEKHRQIELIK